MNKHLPVLIVLLGFGLVGCASTKVAIASKKEVIEYPVLDTIVQQELGDTLVEYGLKWASPTLRISKEFKTDIHPITRIFYVIEPQILKPTSIDAKGRNYFVASEWSIYGGISINQKASVLLPMFGNIEGLCFNGLADINREECIGQEYLEKATYYDRTVPSVKQQLIYNGRIGTNVKFLYREISDGQYLRQPFTQDIQYDLSEGKIIGFKGARIEIVEATNRQISYKVLKHFDPIE